MQTARQHLGRYRRGRPARASSLYSLLCFACLAVLGSVGNARAAVTYYAAKTGCSNTGPGSKAYPFCSAAKGASLLKAGDTLIIGAGTYAERLVVSEVPGTATAPVTIKAAPGAVVVFDGSRVPVDDAGLIHVEFSSYVTLTGLTARLSRYYGINVSGSSNVTLSAMKVDTSQHGGIVVDQGSAYVVVTGCDVNRADSCGSGCGVHEGLTVSESNSVTVANNRIHDGTMEGIDVKDGSKGADVYGNTVYNNGAVGIYLNHTTGSRFYRNRVYNNGASGFQLTVGDGAMGAALTTGNKIYLNVVTGNRFCGVEFWPAGAGSLSGNAIYNNVFYANKQYALEFSDQSSMVKATLVRNNISMANPLGGFTGKAAAVNTISNNLFSGSAPAGQAAVVGDAKFVNATAGDFRLQAGSPAIDKGYDMGLPRLGAPDIGAIEYGLVGAPPIAGR
ncbi:MAG: right-handed parallel beta-helix repeat-containing protein [Deltaproteobacteria bacterium]|nr:right-handed parallel beta-helix repeat-containing protein [Deltaproteobacteria bacterium]